MADRLAKLGMYLSQEHAALQHVPLVPPSTDMTMITQLDKRARAADAPIDSDEQRSAESMFYEFAGRRLRVLRWRAHGEVKQVPMLFFSGIGSNAEILAPFMASMTDRDVITFDAPGIGGSTISGGPYRLSKMAAAASAILDMLAYERVDVMGVSWGGMLAQQFAHSYGLRTRRLVLAATTAGVIMVPGRLSALATMLDLRRFKSPEFLSKHFDTLYGGGNLGWDKYAAGVQAPTVLGYAYQLGALSGWTSMTFLSRIKAKTLIIGGTDDSLVKPINLKVLNALIPRSELRLLDGAGHMFLLSHLGDATSIVRQFLDVPNT
jgi:poly(3-hydroxyalkanoate) depolymerase